MFVKNGSVLQIYDYKYKFIKPNFPVYQVVSATE